MIYLQNTKIIKDIEILQDLPALNTPVLSDIETGATIVLGTQLSVSNMPTGATLYVNGSSVQGSTFTITPVATARNNGYNYTINLQYKGVSGFEDSEIASYTLKMKNPTPTVSLDSGVFTQSSKSITVTRQENVYETEQDQRCIRGEYDSTSEGTWCNVLMLSDTSTYCQFNFFIRETDYADRSDVVTRYYHIAGSESMPTSTINYDENNENFTISVNNWPTDPVNGSYMSSDYTIYYSINSETVNTQYNSIAISCSAGDTIRAKVVSGAGFTDSATTTYSVPVPTPEGMQMLNETFDNIDVSEDGYTDISSQLDNYTDNQGWTGNKVYTAPGGGVKIGTASYAGNITSPDISMINTDATLTVTVNAKQWSNSSGTINNTLLVELIGSGTVDEEGANEFILTGIAADYTVTFTNITTSTVKISITGGNRCYLYNVSAVSNEGSFVPTPEPEPTSIPFNPASVTGNVPTSLGSSGEGTLSNGGVEIYCDNWYIGGSQYRTQNGATLIRITGTTYITKIEFDGVENYGCSNMSLSSGDGSFDDTDAPNGVYTGNGTDTLIEFYLSNRVRFTEIRVYLGDEIPEVSSNELWFIEEEGIEAHVGEEIEATLMFGVRDSGEEVEVNDSENCTLSSDNESVATVEWRNANEEGDEPLYVPTITCVGEGSCTIIAIYEGIEAQIPLTVTAAE